MIERIVPLNVSLADVRTAFDSSGFADALLSGNDVIVGTADSELYPTGAFLGGANVNRTRLVLA